jgi:hypothetical protein
MIRLNNKAPIKLLFLCTMRFRAIFLIILSMFFALPPAKEQNVPIGQWKDYLSYHQSLKVTVGPTMAYCSNTSGVFSYNMKDNSLEKYNKVTGLSDIGTTVARYAPYNNTLFVGYSDGNMDVVQNGQVVNIPDLKNSSVTGNKIINDVYFSNNIAYVSCGQGIMQLDISQNIILNTFYIGSNSSAINVEGVTICNDSIFAATDNGIYKAYLYDADLNNFYEWRKVTSKVLAPGKYNAITSIGNTVYTSFSNQLTHGVSMRDTIYTYTNGQWSHYSYVQGTDFVNSLESANGDLIISDNSDVKVINSSGTLIGDVSTFSGIGIAPKDAVMDASMNLWIADIYSSMVKVSLQGSGQAYCPPGPFSNNVFSISIENNDVWITPGGYNNAYNNIYDHADGVSVEYNGTWNRLLDSGDSLFDINCLAIDPGNPAHAFAGTWQNGVVEYYAPKTVSKVYSTNNSALQNVDGGPGYYSVRNGGIAFDAQGNLWVTNNIAKSKYLSVRKADGTWLAFDFSNITGVTQAMEATQLLITQSGAKWIVIPRSGILVYQDNGTFAQPNASNSIMITSAPGNGALPSLNVSCLAQDQDGTVWVGNNTQVVAFYSPDAVLDGQHDWDAQNIYVQQGTYTQYLMQNQIVEAITIDGDNRKWIGTYGGGVFLMSADGTQQINNFTTSNSPLLSNNITCITINPLDGEVFFGTYAGTESYRGNATEGSLTFGNVYAFPDPVPHGYSGNVSITGLVADADVKITDESGELVYHTTATGGEASWNCNNFNGQRVKSGVYLVFCASPDGTQSRVTKLVVLN